MSKWAADLVMDKMLDWIALGYNYCVCSQQPTTAVEAFSTYKLSVYTINGTDFTKSDGDTSGRKLNVHAQSGMSITASGTATHIAICTNTDLFYVTTCPDQILTSGGTVAVSAWDIEVADPT